MLTGTYSPMTHEKHLDVVNASLLAYKTECARTVLSAWAHVIKQQIKCLKNRFYNFMVFTVPHFIEV